MTTSNILVVDDEADIRMLIDEILSDEGYQVTTAGGAAEAREKASTQDLDLVLLDIWMPDQDGITLLREWSGDGEPGCPVVIMSGHGTVETAVEATRHGAADFIEKPVSISKLLCTVESAIKSGGRPMQAENPARMPVSAMPVGRSTAIRNLRQALEQTVGLASPVLLVGESGSDREVSARYVHALSGRRSGPFVSCRGAQLDADRASGLLLGMTEGDSGQPGFIEQAAGGVFYISDIQFMSDSAQQLLSGILEKRQYLRFGAGRAVPTDARVVASITADALMSPEETGVNRELIDRLAISRIEVPTLRSYLEDVPELLRVCVEHFVDANQLPFRHFSVAAQNRLRNYPWPGNVRELRSLVQQLLLKAGPEEIPLKEVEAALPAGPDEEVSLLKRDLLSLPLREAREQFEKAYLTQQLELSDGKVGELAKRVGMERTHLYRKLRSLGIDTRQKN